MVPVDRTLEKKCTIHRYFYIPDFQATKGRQTTAGVTNAAKALMQRVGIAELAHHDITQVSGGQLQRACICRALMNKPKVIFCDEPTGALNSKSAQEMMDIFAE